MPKCTKDEIIRSGYTRKDGVKVKSVCVPDKGKPGKTKAKDKVLPKPTINGLGKYGYKDVKKMLARDRHTALEKGVKKEGILPITRRLNLISNYTKNSDPKFYKILQSDINWVNKHLKKEIKAGKHQMKNGEIRQLYRLPKSTSKYYYYPSGGKKYV